MSKLYYKGICQFTNDKSINIKNGELRENNRILSKEEFLDKYKYIYYEELMDIARLDNKLLDYDMSEVPRLRLMNIALNAKGSIQDLNSDCLVELSVSDEFIGQFIIYICVQEDYNKFAKISISTNRTCDIIVNPEDQVIKDIFHKIESDFNELSKLT